MGIEYKISGLMQLAAVLIISIYLFLGIAPKSYALYAAIFFILKGVAFSVFKKNPLSLLDAASGVYLLFPVMGWFSNPTFNVIAILFLTQKGVIYLLR